jgi:hypothetical protein
MTSISPRSAGSVLLPSVLLLCGSVSGLVHGSDDGWPVEVTLAAGLHYDDLVTVEELDQVRDVGDGAVVFDLDLDYEKNFSQGTDLRLGYSLSQKSYFEETDFDLQIHNVSFGLKHNFENFDLGIETYHVHARLDNDELLSFQHVSPYFTRFLTRRLYLRGSYFYRDKDFPDNPARDGDVHAADADVYYFLDGTRHYFVAGFRYEDEDTRDPEFDFRGRQFELRYSRRFDLYGDRPVRLRLDYRYEDRDYRSLTPSIGEQRDDLRQRWRARMDFPVRENLTALLSYQYRDHDSNLESADFTDNRFEVQLEVTF